MIPRSLTWNYLSKMSLELFYLPPISRGGSNPFGSLGSSKNSRPRMEFEKVGAGSNKPGERRLSRECSTCKHHMLPPCVVLGFIL
jgi:hypothetical protein